MRSDDKTSAAMMKEMIEKSNLKKEARLRAEREPKINHGTYLLAAAGPAASLPLYISLPLPCR